MGEEGCIGVPESLLRREQERTEKLLKKKEANIDGQANQAYLHLFMRQFKEKQNEIQLSLENAVLMETNQRSDIFHKIAADLNLLHRHLASASSLLTPYDLRRLKDTMVELERTTLQAQQTLMPKKKFGFKKKAEINGINNSEMINKCKNINGNDIADGLSIDLINDSISGPGFHNMQNEKLILNEEQVCGQEVNLSNLQHCTVIIQGCPSSVFIRSISNTTLLLGPVSTSVLLYGASNCSVSAFCHQMRIHDSNSSDFYVHVATDPIIENCRNVRFAPYSYSYQSINKDVESSGLDPNINKWDCVKDFDWLVVSHPSPYWSVLPSDQRCIHWPD